LIIEPASIAQAGFFYATAAHFLGAALRAAGGMNIAN
jgi:hypothetical protein